MNYHLIKRLFDYVSSAIGLMLLTPLFIPIILILKFTSEGEIFYLQKRIGQENKSFGMIKFATMLKNSQNMSYGTITIPNDPRVTRFGAFLRKTKINELPQIINVLKGDLSLIGPRPLPKNESDLYNANVKDIISKMRPGITGIGSLIFRDEEGIIAKNMPENPKLFYENVILPYKGVLEVWYFHNISFRTDMKILFLTFWSLLKKDSGLVYKWFPAIPSKPNELII
ncbi:MAG: sugar transferase [Saprospiraceae bacterium]|nr:sugar transferase [Saprospiraceae bacterium]MBK8547540.1 sugar transferase [Saprospiraceae bacterium]